MSDDARRDAAAWWLFDQTKIRGVWARLKGGSLASTRLKRGIWYEIRGHDATRKMVAVKVDGEEEEEVVLDYLVVRADAPEKTVVYSTGEWGSPAGEMVHIAVCPKGHLRELRPGTADSDEGFCWCSGCHREFAYEWE